MKHSFILFIFAFLFTITSCKDDECLASSDTRCQDFPESGMCAAFFQNWFYDAQTNSCELIGYSGCNAVGFDTQADCEACQCSR